MAYTDSQDGSIVVTLLTISLIFLCVSQVLPWVSITWFDRGEINFYDWGTFGYDSHGSSSGVIGFADVLSNPTHGGEDIYYTPSVLFVLSIAFGLLNITFPLMVIGLVLNIFSIRYAKRRQNLKNATYARKCVYWTRTAELAAIICYSSGFVIVSFVHIPVDLSLLSRFDWKIGFLFSIMSIMMLFICNRLLKSHTIQMENEIIRKMKLRSEVVEWDDLDKSFDVDVLLSSKKGHKIIAPKRVKGLRCTKCGSERLDIFQDGSGTCLACNYMFKNIAQLTRKRLPPPPPPTKKVKTLKEKLDEIEEHPRYKKKRIRAKEITRKIAMDEEKRYDFLEVGKKLLEKGETEKSIKFFDKVLLKDSSNEAALIGKSHALYKENNFFQAWATLEKVLATNPNHEEALLIKGKVLERLEKPEMALKCYVNVVNINPFNKEAQSRKDGVLKSLGRTKEVTKKQHLQSSEENGKEEAIAHLLSIPGVGMSKAHALYTAGFTKIDLLKNASVDELNKVNGISQKLAKQIINHLQNEDN